MCVLSYCQLRNNNNNIDVQENRLQEVVGAGFRQKKHKNLQSSQYLSPILWKAHVIDGSSRFAEHNIYKSDVFSAGLVLIQLALMNEVTGFNSKTP